MRPDPDRDGWFVGPDLHHGQATAWCWTAAHRCPTRWVVGCRTACTARRGRSTPQDWPGATTRGGAGRCARAPCCTSCTWAPSPPPARWTRPSSGSTTCVDLGVTHVELMPLAAFDGPRGWGYDGVALNAVHEPYGGPFALARFVDAAHAPGTRRAARRRPQPCRTQRQPLGAVRPVPERHPHHAVGQGGQPRRARVGRRPLDPAGTARWAGCGTFTSTGCGWTRCTRCSDGRARPFLAELSDAVAALSVDLGRPLALVAESDRNDPRTVRADRRSTASGMSAQWDDDVHHALHWLLTDDASGIFADFASCAAVAYTLEHGFWHDGRWSSFRGQSWGAPMDWATTRRCAARHVAADPRPGRQPRPTANGCRSSPAATWPPAAPRSCSRCPTRPCCSWARNGVRPRRGCSSARSTSRASPTRSRQVGARELAAQGWGADAGDPQDPESRVRSVLDWGEADSGAGAEMLAWYRTLIGLRAGARSRVR